MRIALVMVVLGVFAAGCSKKSAPAAGQTSAGSAAAPAAAAPPAAPAAPAAAVPGVCAACQQYDACCTALLADGSGDVAKSECDDRAATCSGTTADMKADMNDTCKQRVADWHTAHPDVAACK